MLSLCIPLLLAIFPFQRNWLVYSRTHVFPNHCCNIVCRRETLLSISCVHRSSICCTRYWRREENEKSSSKFIITTAHIRPITFRSQVVSTLEPTGWSRRGPQISSSSFHDSVCPAAVGRRRQQQQPSLFFFHSDAFD